MTTPERGHSTMRWRAARALGPHPRSGIPVRLAYGERTAKAPKGLPLEPGDAYGPAASTVRTP